MGSPTVIVGHDGVALTDAGGEFAIESTGTCEPLYSVARLGQDWLSVGGALHVGGDSLLLHRGRDGVYAQEASGMQHVLLSVAAGSGSFFACAYNGALLRGTRGAFTRQPFEHYEHCFGIAARGERAVAVGLHGSAVYFDGAQWLSIKAETDAHLRDVAIGADGTVLAVGLGGVVLTGAFASPLVTVHQSSAMTLESVTFVSPEEAVAVGSRGTVLWVRRKAGGIDVTSETLGKATLHAVDSDGEKVVAVGAGGTVWSRSARVSP